MTLRKVADAPPPLCRHPEHLPPVHVVLEPGLWEHECLACHEKTLFRVHRAEHAAVGSPPSPIWAPPADGRGWGLM